MRCAFQPGLQNELRRHGIEQRLGGFGVTPGFPQPAFGIARSQAFVGQGDGQGKMLVQSLGKFSCQLGHGMWCAIGVRGQANHQLLRLPFGDQLADFSQALGVAFGMNDGQGMGGA